MRRCGMARPIPIAVRKSWKRKARRNPAWAMRTGYGGPERKQVPFGNLAAFLSYQASAPVRRLRAPNPELVYASQAFHYIGNNQTTDLELPYGERIGVFQPFYWQNMTHLVLPDIVHRMERDQDDGDQLYDGDGEDELWEFNWEEEWEFEAFGEFANEPGAQPFTWWDLLGFFYVVPQGNIAAIDFRTPQYQNIDYHPSVQMSLYGLLLALRKERCILPETVMLTWYQGWRDIDDIWDFILEAAASAEAYDKGNDAYFEEPSPPYVADEWNTIVHLAGASDAALYPNVRAPSELREDDMAAILYYFAHEDEWMPLSFPRAGEAMETLAAGPYSCNVRYAPVPGVPGYQPSELPGGRAPRVIAPPPESYDLYGGPTLPPPAAHPSATHAPQLRIGAPIERKKA